MVADDIGIEDTLHTLRQFTNELDAKEDRIFVVSGYATKLGDAKKNLPLMEEARNLGRQMAESLKEGT